MPSWFMAEAKEELLCAICRDWMIAAHGLPCSHTFCGSCLFNWLSKKNSCPVCRQVLRSQPVPIRSSDKLIFAMLEHTRSREVRPAGNT